MSFCTTLSCMDGRIQLPVIEFLKKKFNAEFVDTITEAGMIRHLAENNIELVRKRVEISLNNHKSVGMAVAAHHDCAGNPVSKDEQLKHIQKSKDHLKSQFPNVPIVGMWLDDLFKVHEV